jgi:hypothetical protein
VKLLAQPLRTTSSPPAQSIHVGYWLLNSTRKDIKVTKKRVLNSRAAQGDRICLSYWYNHYSNRKRDQERPPPTTSSHSSPTIHTRSSRKNCSTTKTRQDTRKTRYSHCIPSCENQAPRSPLTTLDQSRISRIFSHFCPVRIFHKPIWIISVLEDANTNAVAVQLRFGALSLSLLRIQIHSFPVSISISTVVSKLLFNPKATLHHVPSKLERSASSMRF